MALPDDLDANRHAFDRQHRHGYGGSSKDRSRAIEHRIPSATEAVRSRPGRAEADQRVGQWGNRGESVLRLRGITSSLHAENIAALAALSPAAQEQEIGPL